MTMSSMKASTQTSCAGWMGAAEHSRLSSATVTEPEVPHFYPDRDRDRTDGAGSSSPAPTSRSPMSRPLPDATRRAALDVHARERMQEARDVIAGLVAEGATVYGVTTGFGALASTSIAADDAPRLQETPPDESRGRCRAGVPS